MEIIDKDGRRRTLRPGEALRDGDRLVVASNFMDRALHDGMGGAAGHRPGFVFASTNDAERRAEAATARQEYVARISDAWRKP